MNRDFTVEAPNRVWIADFTYVRTGSGFAFIIDVYSQRIVGWHAQTSRGVELVRIPLRLALWERDRTQYPVVAGELTHHSDAGSKSHRGEVRPGTWRCRGLPRQSAASARPTTTP